MNPESQAVHADPIKESIIVVLQALQGHPGDLFVLFTICLSGYMVKRKRYQGAVGALVLTLGTVLLRVLIYLFFGTF